MGWLDHLELSGSVLTGSGRVVLEPPHCGLGTREDGEALSLLAARYPMVDTSHDGDQLGIGDLLMCPQAEATAPPAR